MGNILRFGFSQPIKHNGDKKKMDKKGFKKVELPELVKLDEKNNAVSGVFIGINKSGKFEDAFALDFKVGEKIKRVFINNLAKQLFESQRVKEGAEFILEWTGMQKNADGTQEYRVFELYVKN